MDSPITRRDALRTVSAAAAAVVLSESHMPSAVAAKVDENGIIDAHSHIWTPDVQRYPLAGGQTRDDLKPPSFTAEELLALVRPLGVARVVLIQHKPYHGVDNSYITDAMAEFPGVFSAVACIEADQAHPEKDMDRLRSLGARGFRIRPGEGGTDKWIDSAGMNAMWAHAAETGVAICPLLGPSDLPQVDAMCTKYPDTTVVIDHCARIGTDGEIRDADVAALAALHAHLKVHVKVSAFYALSRQAPEYSDLAPMIRRLYDAYGAKRLMWASDCPYQLAAPNTYEASLALVRDRLDFLSDEDRSWLLTKTAASVYFA